jgi:hypothetical protein
MDFIKIMKNAVRPPDFSSGTSYQATVTKGTQVRDNTGILSKPDCFSNSRDICYGD